MKMDFLKAKAKQMIKNDEKRDEIMLAVDDMHHCIFSLPVELKKKVRKSVNTSAHDALRAATNVFSRKLPQWDVQPLKPNAFEADRAEQVETALRWLYRMAALRSNCLWDNNFSALAYDASAAWIDYLPYWYDKGKNARERGMLARGPFVIVHHNPRFVHVEKTPYGDESVLLSKNIPAREAVACYGKDADRLASKLTEEKDDGSLRFQLYDMLTWDDGEPYRTVWGYLTESINTNAEQGGSDYVFTNKKFPLPFFPWAVKMGGSNLETIDYSIHPMLAALHWSGKWQDLCIYESLVVNEIIKYAKTPRVKTITPSGEGVLIDYQDGSQINLRIGEDALPWAPAPIDSNLKELWDRIAAQVVGTTGARVLQDVAQYSNVPYASLNAMLQLAIANLSPARALAEHALEEQSRLMLQWIKFTQDSLITYRVDSDSIEDPLRTRGAQIIIQPTDFDLESLYISCKLNDETPTDMTERVNQAIMLTQNFPYPKKKALEDLGKANVDLLEEQRWNEDMDATTLRMHIEQMEAAQQMMMQQQMQQQPQQSPQQEPPPQGFPSNAQGIAPFKNLKGRGFNPNVGGHSPAAGAPSQTREIISGKTKGGAPIGGV